MSKTLTENKVFEGIDYTEEFLTKDDYDNCSFTNCSFYKSDLSGIIFNDCKFDSCDMSLAAMNNTTLNNVNFINCKLLGLHFEDCNEFVISISFENCILKLSTFYKQKLKSTKFINCNLKDVDFGETDLSGSTFDNCDLLRATFDHTNLEKVDFRSAFNYSIDPENNRIKKAKFSRLGVTGLLDKYNIIIE